MKPTFFFYDLETSGLKPSEARIMQFAGQRTDMKLNPIGDPVNVLIKLTPDTLPDPDAVLLTGITPQKTLEEGVTEAEFLKLFYKEVASPATIFVGFNNVRFDDEFIRYTNYRNFYDPYAWTWQDGRSRWDILDLVRMTRALRPDGINWPFKESKPINRLEELTKANGLAHDAAHDALSDVQATIAVAKLILETQPKLFDYLLKLRTKAKVADLINKQRPFVYTSNHYPAEYLHTTLVSPLVAHPDGGAYLVYNLRNDPKPYLSMSPASLVEAWQYNEDPTVLRLPIKTLKFNRVPAVAPLSVIDKSTELRLGIDLSVIQANHQLLVENKTAFSKNLLEALSIMNKKREDLRVSLLPEADYDLYGGFLDNLDVNLFKEIHATSPDNLNAFLLKLNDKRLKSLLPLYKARNFPESLNGSEKLDYQEFCKSRISAEKVSKYRERMNELYEQSKNQRDRALLDELKAYLEMVL
ncbi:MAG TPA: exodeoxyribonuclease I [Candidatus Saccharimonadales bacterium]|nr:exodeoxyribonuclease I [Candidatus Saccharimonadales bacterium]